MSNTIIRPGTEVAPISTITTAVQPALAEMAARSKLGDREEEVIDAEWEMVPRSEYGGISWRRFQRTLTRLFGPETKRKEVTPAIELGWSSPIGNGCCN